MNMTPADWVVVWRQLQLLVEAMVWALAIYMLLFCLVGLIYSARQNRQQRPP